MLVQFNEISPKGNDYEIHVAEFPGLQQEFEVKEPLQARYTLKRKGELKVEVRGELRGVLSLVCDRCLAGYDFDVNSELQVVLEVASIDAWHLKDLECNAQDMDCIILDEPNIDLDDLLRQQIYLALPLKRLCFEECKGLCLHCGVNLNLEPCLCEAYKEKSPFSVLTRLTD